MEINGVANIQIMISSFKDEGNHSQEVLDFLTRLDAQAKNVDRYMMAINDIIKPLKVRLPAWSDVRDNPEFYPTNQERWKGAKSCLQK